MEAETPCETFEQSFETAEEAVAFLEKGDLSLEDSLAKYEQGLLALRRCYSILKDAQKRVEVLSGGVDFQDEQRGPDDRGKLDGDSPEGASSEGLDWKPASTVEPLREALDRIESEVSDDPKGDD